MYTYKKKDLKKGTLSFTVTIEKKAVDEKYDPTVKLLAENLELEGFRKGKAPLDLAKKAISSQKVYEKILDGLLGTIYEEILKKEDIKPVISPKVNLVEAQEDKDWVLEIQVALKPTIKLPDYKKLTQEAKKNTKSSEIWTPGKDTSEPTEEQKSQEKQALINEILGKLIENTKLEISDLIIEEELKHKLSRLLEDVQKLGLKLEDYLKSRNTTIEQVREAFTKEVIDTYMLEFMLSDIADKEEIKVEEADLKQLMGEVKDPQAQKQIEQNAYFYATLLRKQKTIDYLLGL